MNTSRTLATMALLGILAFFGAPAEAQTSTGAVPAVPIPANPRAARAPFGPGERLIYSVKVGIFNAGRGHMTVESLDTIRGHETYHAVMGIKGGLGPLKVDDTYSSWFDVRNLQSWRYIRDIHEPYYESYRHYEMYPEKHRWERADNDEFGTLGSALPLDDIGFIYFVRTLPLEVGKTFTYNRYFKEDGNPVTLKVVRKDRREVGAGEFNTIVVEPVIRTDGLFGEGGKAEMHFTDDDRRLLVYLKSDIPNFPGSLTLHLEEIREGLPLNPRSRAAAQARGVAEPSR